MSLDFAARRFRRTDSRAGHPGHVPDCGLLVPRNIELGQRDRQGHTPIGGVPLSRPSIPHDVGSGVIETVHGLRILLVTTDADPWRSRQRGVDGSLPGGVDSGVSEPHAFVRCRIFRFEFPI